MASRAFFRCRGCGEPVVSGAYRCPVCGIDFPTGTPNTPTTPDSPAAVDPTKRTRPRAPAGEDTRTRSAAPQDIASRLQGALDDELTAPDPADDPAADAREVWVDVETGRGDLPRAERTRGAPPASTADDQDAWSDADDAAEEDTDPTADSDEERGRADLDAGTIVPGQARASAQRSASGLTVAPKREPRVVVAEPRTREIMVVPRRRNIAKTLGGTVVMGLIAVVALAGAAVYLEQNGLARFGLFETSRTAATGRSLSITAEDGWVAVPAEPGAVIISADGTYRVRLDGKVFTGGPEQRLRVPITTGTSLSVRSVRAPTVATVTRAD